jgi:hypothetical protein
VKKLGKKTYKRTRFSTKKRKVWELIMDQIIKEFPSLIHLHILTKHKEISKIVLDFLKYQNWAWFNTSQQ